jgi:hypothetical protein
MFKLSAYEEAVKLLKIQYGRGIGPPTTIEIEVPPQ